MQYSSMGVCLWRQNRHVKFEHRCSVKIRVAKGCPQEGLLSPLLVSCGSLSSPLLRENALLLLTSQPKGRASIVQLPSILLNVSDAMISLRPRLWAEECELSRPMPIAGFQSSLFKTSRFGVSTVRSKPFLFFSVHSN